MPRHRAGTASHTGIPHVEATAAPTSCPLPCKVAEEIAELA